MRQRLTKPRFLLLAALVGADGLFFGLSNPGSIASIGLIIGFALFVITLYAAVQGVLRIGRWYGLPASKRQKHLALVAVVVLSALVALQSMGQLSGRDLLVLLPLCAIGYFYALYAPAPGNDQ